MVATLNDTTVVHHHDPIGIADGTETVGNDEGGATLHEGVHAMMYELFGAGIYTTGGLVENQGWRIGHGSAGNGNELALSLGEQ